jgi:hypothetical protein
MPPMPYPPAYPHDPIEEIASDLFMVRGSVRLNALMRITRNMAIVRHQGELNLVNPIRVNEDAERELFALGDVKRILRLGAMHGLDDRYYVERFDAELWAQGESETYPVPKIAAKLAADRPLPFPDAELFGFTEGRLRAPAHSGLRLPALRPRKPAHERCEGIRRRGDTQGFPRCLSASTPGPLP